MVCDTLTRIQFRISESVSGSVMRKLQAYEKSGLFYDYQRAESSLASKLWKRLVGSSLAELKIGNSEKQWEITLSVELRWRRDGRRWWWCWWVIRIRNPFIYLIFFGLTLVRFTFRILANVCIYVSIYGLMITYMGMGNRIISLPLLLIQVQFGHSSLTRR